MNDRTKKIGCDQHGTHPSPCLLLCGASPHPSKLWAHRYTRRRSRHHTIRLPQTPANAERKSPTKYGQSREIILALGALIDNRRNALCRGDDKAGERMDSLPFCRHTINKTPKSSTPDSLLSTSAVAGYTTLRGVEKRRRCQIGFFRISRF